MKYYLFPLLAILLIACKEEKDPFEIGNDHIGMLQRSTLLTEVDSVYAQDSIVKDTRSFNLGNLDPRIKIFEKGGAHLLTLTPGDSTFTTINIHDPRYKTAEGVGLSSTFGDIEANYEIEKIVTTLRNVIVFVKGSDAYFTIDREELPASLRYATDIEIEAVQIPEDAKIKYVMVGWDPNP